ncbi:MAG: MBL fold metallo-hydrolase [Bacteroidales bacterium]|nr:MBL fold metallo-hydrolase [Bacteroidales bacterium]
MKSLILFFIPFIPAMKIVSLSDNITRGACASEHGLSLYLETDAGIRVLFDMGQGDVFARNAERLGIDLSQVDVAVVSHGHYDHGGGLATFLRLNDRAPVYVTARAFEPHYSVRPAGTAFIGLDASLAAHPQLVHNGLLCSPAPGLTLFSGVTGDFPQPAGTARLLGPDARQQDDFAHEQSLLIEEEGHTVLIGGCAHAGLVSMMQRAEQLSGHSLTHVFSGMHLMMEPQSPAYLRQLAAALLRREGCLFYTMHCTGAEAFGQMSSLMPGRLHYLAVGGQIEI